MTLAVTPQPAPTTSSPGSSTSTTSMSTSIETTSSSSQSFLAIFKKNISLKVFSPVET